MLLLQVAVQVHDSGEFASTAVAVVGEPGAFRVICMDVINRANLEESFPGLRDWLAIGGRIRLKSSAHSQNDVLLEPIHCAKGGQAMVASGVPIERVSTHDPIGDNQFVLTKMVHHLRGVSHPNSTYLTLQGNGVPVLRSAFLREVAQIEHCKLCPNWTLMCVLVLLATAVAW